MLTHRRYSIVSCALVGPMTQTTFSAPLTRSYPRGASPEAVSFPAAAIQLSARIALLRRAKARWILFGGPPALCSRAEPGISARQGDALAVRSQGDEIRSMCKPVPNTDVADELRLVCWKLLLTLGLPGRALCLLFCRFLCGLLLPELRQLPLIFRLKFRCLPRIHAIRKANTLPAQGIQRPPGDFFIQPKVCPKAPAFALKGNLTFFHSVAPPSSEASAKRAARRASFFAAFFAACSALYFSSCAASSV